MDIGGIEVIGTGSRLLTAEDVAEVTKHIEQLESENAKLRKCCVYYDRDNNTCGYHDPISHRLEAENAKLREELEQWHRLTAGIELPEYPITEFKPKDLERENAKLRELVKRMWYVFIGIKRATFADRLRTRHEIDELGIEVDK